MRRFALVASALLMVGLVASPTSCSCGGQQGEGEGGTGAIGISSGAMEGNSSATTASGLGGGFSGSSSSSSLSGQGGIMQCAGDVAKAELLPLDIYFMLDTSGSMADKTGKKMNGPSKWSAVQKALKTFFTDPMSAGIGAGLQFFPLPSGAPASCTSDADCVNFGTCVLKICTGEKTLIPCKLASDCPAFGEQCGNLGICGNQYCVPPGGICANQQLCLPVQSGMCSQTDSCTDTDYATPAVEIQMLNGAAATLDNAVMAKSPDGATPTAPALGGAIAHAQAWAAAHPTHAVVAVMATDGLPTECAPQDIPSISAIAAQGLAGSPSIKTFVIGVFATTDMNAKQNLDAIATAGGTSSAFIVDPTMNVEQAFVAALTAIRGSKIACEFSIPDPPDGGILDFSKVNVKYTPPNLPPVTLAYVASLAHCDSTTGGWYYDVDPGKGGTPSKIIVCPASCTAFGGVGEVGFELGCQTVTVPPK